MRLLVICFLAVLLCLAVGACRQDRMPDDGNQAGTGQAISQESGGSSVMPPATEPIASAPVPPVSEPSARAEVAPPSVPQAAASSTGQTSAVPQSMPGGTTAMPLVPTDKAMSPEEIEQYFSRRDQQQGQTPPPPQSVAPGPAVPGAVPPVPGTEQGMPGGTTAMPLVPTDKAMSPEEIENLFSQSQQQGQMPSAQLTGPGVTGPQGMPGMGQGMPGGTSAMPVVSTDRAMTPDEIEGYFAQRDQQHDQASSVQAVAPGAVPLPPDMAQGMPGMPPGMEGGMGAMPLVTTDETLTPEQAQEYFRKLRQQQGQAPLTQPGGLGAMGGPGSPGGSPGAGRVQMEPSRKPTKTVPATAPSDLPAVKYATLIEAAAAGDAADVENHILRGENINARDTTGATALHWAARNGFVPVLEVLLDYGANVNQMEREDSYSPPILAAYKAGKFDAAAILRDYGAMTSVSDMAAYGDVEGIRKLVRDFPAALAEESVLRETPLHIAAQAGSAAVVECLLDSGMNPVPMNIAGDTPFSLAAMSNKGDVVQVMVKKGIDVDMRGPRGETVLYRKARSGDKTLIDLLLSLGANINAKDTNGAMPLHAAVIADQKEMVTFLVDKGALIDGSDKKGRTALHEAASRGLVDMIDVLIARGAKVDRRDRTGASPLHLAAAEAQDKAVTALLARGADVASADRYRQTPLHAMAGVEEEETSNNSIQNLRIRRTAVAQALLAKGANIEARERDGKTPLYVAASSGQGAMVRFLREKGADIEAVDLLKRTPIIGAIKNDRFEVMKQLLDLGATVTAQDSQGRTAVHFAAELARPDALVALLSCGCAPHTADGREQTPFVAACAKGAVQSAQVLLAYGARVDGRDANQQTPLHAAAEGGDAQLAKILLACGADANARDASSRTPMHIAVEKANAGVVQVLVNGGADLNPRNSLGYTPLHLAATHGRVNIARFLIEHGADANLRDNEGSVPLDIAEQKEHQDLLDVLRPVTKNAFMLAVEAGDMETAKRLLDETPRFGRARANGVSAFHVTARDGLVDFFSLLAARRTNVREPEDNYWGFTALHEAARGGHKEIVDMLLAKGAKTDVVDSKGRTPLEWAQARGHADVIKALTTEGSPGWDPAKNKFDRDHVSSESDKKLMQMDKIPLPPLGIRITILLERDSLARRIVEEDPQIVNAQQGGRPVLLMAVSRGKSDVVALLLEHGADVNAKSQDQTATTALHEAARLGNKDVVAMLVSKGADVTAKDAAGKTAADVARESGRQDFLPLLEAAAGPQK